MASSYMEDFWGDVAKDTTTDLLSSLLSAGIKSGVRYVTRVARAGIAARLEAWESASSVDTAATPEVFEKIHYSQSLDGQDFAFDLSEFEILDFNAAVAPSLTARERTWPLADPVAREFLLALHLGDHATVCKRCASALFDHPNRRAVLLDTLQSARPIAWHWVDYVELEHTHERGPKRVVFDLDVEFQLETGIESLPLRLYMRRFGDEWKIWEFWWGLGNT